MNPYVTFDPTNPYAAALFLCVTIWSLVWKGIALWKASKNNQKYWFIALLLINTVGILEITYLKFFQKMRGQKEKDVFEPEVIKPSIRKVKKISKK